MKHKSKALGLALLIALALAAVSASAASAANYTASGYPATGTGESPVGNDTFTTEAGKVECNSHFQSTLNAASSTLTVTPKYTGCKAFGFLSATVHTNGCDYLFTEPTGTAPNFTAPVDVSCPTGKVIEVTAATCKVTVGAQGPLNSVAITNNAGGDVSVKAGVTGVAYTVTQDGFGCPFSGTGTKTGATYTQDEAITVQGAATVTGPYLFTASSYPMTATAVSAQGNNRFNTEAGALECNAHYQGTLTGSSESITVTPTYTECPAPWVVGGGGVLRATVHMNGCDYLFREPTGGPHAYTAKMDITCPVGNAITITSGTCHVSIPSQTGLSNVTINNETAGSDVSIQMNVTGINYTVVSDGFGCVFSGTGSKTGATYTQTNAITFDSTNGASIDVGGSVVGPKSIHVG